MKHMGSRGASSRAMLSYSIAAGDQLCYAWQGR